MTQRTTVNSEILASMAEKTHAGPATTLWRKETVELILGAMGALNLEYRTVLTLRCLEDQSYAEIATVLGGSQMQAKMLFYRAKTALRKQLAGQGLSRSHFLGALTVFGAMTSTSTRTASAIPTVTAASAQATVSGAVLGTVLSKAALIGMSIALAITGTGIVLSTTGVPSMLTAWRKPAIPPWPGPGQPQFDSYMYFMGGQSQYVALGDIAASHNPDQDDWRCLNFPLWQDVRSIASRNRKPARAALVLEQDHWIEYNVFPARLLDRPGPEIGLFVWHSGTLPSVFLTDGDQRLQEISVTHYRGGHAPGVMVLGFDLSGITFDFEVRRLRIVGHDRAGRFGGCGVTSIAVSIAAGK